VSNTQENANLGKIRRFYQQAFRHYDKTGRIPPVSVELYPYAGINHTIRIRGGCAFVRISDVCVDMELDGQRALAFILVAKLYRKRAASVHQEAYNAALRTSDIQKRAARTKKTRGRQTPMLTDGEIYNLDEVFLDVNQKYFGNSIRKPHLSWSIKKTYRVLGHHDATQDKIVISRSLDTPETPRYIVEYVMFHEMLHVKHPTITINGRRYNHTAAFREDERKFPHYRIAERWIEENVRRLKRAAKRK
jgi:predicted metal-dependent hydrolase